MREEKVIQLKDKAYQKFLIYELPTLEVNASIELSFYSPEGKSLTELMAIERKAFDNLAYVHSKLPPEEAERFIQKCLPWWRCMKSLQAEIRRLAIQDLAEQGIEIGKEGTS
jgi:hypothetical protein